MSLLKQIVTYESTICNRILGVSMIKRIGVSSALIASLAVCTVSAQEAGRIQAGKFDIIPTLDSSLSYITNLTRTTDNAREINSWKARLSPGLLFSTQVSNNPVNFGYRIERGEYFTSTDDDYTDHFFTSNGDFELNSRHSVKFDAIYEDGHEERGTGLSIGAGENLTSPDTFKRTNTGVDYTYGSITSPGQLVFSVARSTLDYDRDEEIYLIRDRFTNSFSSEFSYSISSLTYLVFDVTKSFVRYDYNPLNESIRDSDVTRILVGFTWESTAATTGFAKVGYQEKEFAAEDRENFYGTDWEVGVDWQPIEYSNFRLSTSADTRETNGEGNLIRSRDYALTWNHAWYDYFSTNVSVTYIDNTYTLSDETLSERQDDFSIYNVSAIYQARRWLKVSLFYEYSELSSNRDTLGYNRDNVGISFEVTL